jgi:hypothetical protein
LAALNAEIDRVKTLQMNVKRKTDGLLILKMQQNNSASRAMKIRDLDSEIQLQEEKIGESKKTLSDAISKHSSNASLDEARKFISSL